MSPGAGEGWGPLGMGGASPQRPCSLCVLRVCIPLSRLDLAPGPGELRALLQTFPFNCLDVRVITQLNQIKAAYLPEHNREEVCSFFTSQWSINARNR